MAVEKVVGVMRRMTTVVAMLARFLVDTVHVLTMDSAVTGGQLFQHSSCLPWHVSSAVAMGGGNLLSCFDELLAMAVLTASWWMLLMATL